MLWEGTMLNKDMFWWQVSCLILGIHLLLSNQIVEPMRAAFHTIGVILATSSGIVLSAHLLHWWLNRTNNGRRDY